jgi:hypothetical protein
MIGDPSHPALWTGGFYELLLDLEPDGDERLDAAIRAAWSHPGLHDCSTERDLTAPAEPGLHALEQTGHLHGRATIPGFHTTVCGTFAHRDDDADVLDVYLPIGALEHLDPAAASLWGGDDDVPDDWRAPIDAFLHAIADRVAGAAPVRRRRIGWELL